MKKIVIGSLLVIGLFGVFRAKSWANEGQFKLQPTQGSTASCFAVSVYRDNRYQILGSCQNLRVPYSVESGYYLLWSIDEQGNFERLTEVERGKFGVNTDEKFVGLAVSAEKEWSPRKPSLDIVAQGNVEGLPFEMSGQVPQEYFPRSGGGSQVKDDSQEAVVKATPTVSKTAATTKTQTETETEAKKGGSWLGAVGRLLGTIFLLLLGGVVVMSVITKRKGF